MQKGKNVESVCASGNVKKAKEKGLFQGESDNDGDLFNI